MSFPKGRATRMAESVVASFLIMLGGIYAYGIFQIRGREFTSNEIGPSAFPWLLVTLLVILSTTLLARAWFATPRGGTDVLEENGAAAGKTLAAVVLFIAYAVFLEPVGFLWTTPIFLGLLYPLYGARPLPLMAIAGMAIGFTVALHSVLWFGFGVLLP